MTTGRPTMVFLLECLEHFLPVCSKKQRAPQAGRQLSIWPATPRCHANDKPGGVILLSPRRRWRHPDGAPARCVRRTRNGRLIAVSPAGLTDIAVDPAAGPDRGACRC